MDRKLQKCQQKNTHVIADYLGSGFAPCMINSIIDNDNRVKIHVLKVHENIYMWIDAYFLTDWDFI